MAHPPTLRDSDSDSGTTAARQRHAARGMSDTVLGSNHEMLLDAFAGC
jgi:hypothetical protein